MVGGNRLEREGGGRRQEPAVGERGEVHPERVGQGRQDSLEEGRGRGQHESGEGRELPQTMTSTKFLLFVFYPSQFVRKIYGDKLGYLLT